MENKGLNINIRSFIIALAVIIVLWCCTYALTFIVPSGEYIRVTDSLGNTLIDAEAGYRAAEGEMSFVKFLLSPFLVLGAEGGGTIIAVIAFLLVIGGIFQCLDKCGIMEYMLGKIVYKFGGSRYKLMYIVAFFFMAMGAFIGSFEECVPLVPIVVSLAISLGWDSLTGLGMSLLAVGCGFASGVFNPFTVGVAQSLSGIPMFSGVWLRIVSFAVIYGLLVLFLRGYAKKHEKPVALSKEGFIRKKEYDNALLAFCIILGMGILAVLSSSFIPALQSVTMVIVAVAFLAAGLTSCIMAKMKGRELAASFIKGLVGILPAVLLIMVASSVKYILTEAKILDTILYGSVSAAGRLPQWAIVLFIYLLVLIMNFFISSGSAKAFLLIPLIVPMAQLFEISPQLSIVAFAFGDGFSNVFYPTNAALLIALSLVGVGYGEWVKYSWKFQALNLIVTSALLLLGFLVGY